MARQLWNRLRCKQTFCSAADTCGNMIKAESTPQTIAFAVMDFLPSIVTKQASSSLFGQAIGLWYHNLPCTDLAFLSYLQGRQGSLGDAFSPNMHCQGRTAVTPLTPSGSPPSKSTILLMTCNGDLSAGCHSLRRSQQGL